MIKTKSIRDAVEPSDGKRILVMGRWPRGYSKEKLRLDYWYTSLAPDEKLRKDWYAETIGWDKYVARYLKLMKSQRERIKEFAGMAKTGTITLICIEDEGNPHCHRHLLKKLIEQAMQEA